MLTIQRWLLYCRCAALLITQVTGRCTSSQSVYHVLRSISALTCYRRTELSESCSTAAYHLDAVGDQHKVFTAGRSITQATRMALGTAHLLPTKVFRRLSE